MDEKTSGQFDGSPCATGAMGCLLPVSMLLVFGAAMIVAAAAYVLRAAVVPYPAIALGVLALVVFFSFGIAALVLLFMRGGAFGGQHCRCCCCGCSCCCRQTEKAKV